jgi:hypothetical protein
MPDLPGHERRHERRLERHLSDDDPGAPPGFLLDDDDTRSHEWPPFEIPKDRWDLDGEALARGAGEKED